MNSPLKRVRSTLESNFCQTLYAQIPFPSKTSHLRSTRSSFGPVDAADVDGGHGPVGRHAALGRQLLEAGERALRREGVRVAAEERVRAVHAAVPLRRPAGAQFNNLEKA